MSHVRACDRTSSIEWENKWWRLDIAVITSIVWLRESDLIANLPSFRSCRRDADNVAHPPPPEGKGQAGMSHRVRLRSKPVTKASHKTHSRDRTKLIGCWTPSICLPVLRRRRDASEHRSVGVCIRHRDKSSAPAFAKPRQHNHDRRKREKKNQKKQMSVLLVSAIGNQRVPVFKLL